MIRIALIAAASLGALALPAAARENPRDEAAVARILDGKTPQAPRKCLNAWESRNTSVHDGTVLFRISSKLLYKNDMQECHLLHEDDILQTNLYGTSQLCEGDIAQVINRTGRYSKGACTFGEFVPYRR